MLVTIARYVVALTDAVITKVDEARERRARARARDYAFDTRRPHLWRTASGITDCAYCHVEQTATNEHLLCPATGKAPTP